MSFLRSRKKPEQNGASQSNEGGTQWGLTCRVVFDAVQFIDAGQDGRRASQCRWPAADSVPGAVAEGSDGFESGGRIGFAQEIEQTVQFVLVGDVEGHELLQAHGLVQQGFIGAASFFRQVRRLIRPNAFGRHPG